MERGGYTVFCTEQGKNSACVVYIFVYWNRREIERGWYTVLFTERV